ncbi:MAG: ABC transporter permease subunit, partial [Thermoanaerobacterium sp.]|nr:ABC transporter permease subunit [Thermoanaerobacterium sp.]
FKYVPLFGIIIAFKDFRYDKGIWGSEWNGFNNFRFLFKTNIIWELTFRTIAYNLVFMTLGVLVPVALALMLNEVRSRKLIKFYQTSFLLPYFPSWIVVSYIVYALLNPSGLVNNMLQYLGMERINWYQTPYPWIFLLPLINTWKGMGYSALIYYATLIGINQEYYEAAEIDGAGSWHKVKYISIPFLVPVIIVLVLLNLGRLINGDFGLFYQVTQQESFPYLRETTDVINTYVYRALRIDGDIAASSAVSFYQSIVGFIMLVIANSLVRRYDKKSCFILINI